MIDVSRINSALELLETFSGKDQVQHQLIFNYHADQCINKIDIYAIRNRSTDANFSLTWETWKQTNIILRLKTRDGYDGISCVTSFYVDIFDENNLKELEKAIAVFITLKTIDPLKVSHKLRRLIPNVSDLVISSIDIALWDLAAKRANYPLSKLLGAERNKIDAYASLPCYESLDLYIDNIDNYLARGFKVIKLHVWGNFIKDKQLIENINSKFKTTSVRFMMDFEGVYNFSDALTLGQLMNKELFICIEAPIEDNLFKDYHKLREALPMMIIPDGFDLYSIAHLETGITNKSWDAGRFDVSVVGGVTESLKLLIIANQANLPMELQCWGHGLVQLINLHIILANQNSQFFEVPTPIDVYKFGMKDAILLEGNKIHAPDAPGIGIEINWSELATADYYKKISMGAR